MGLVELVWGVTTTLSLLLIWLSATIYTIKQFFFSGRDENLEIHKWLRRTSLTYMCSYSIAYFFILLLTGLALSSNEKFYTQTLGWNSLFSLIIIFGAIGFLSHYLFLSAQVYYSFKPTQYAMPERTMTIYICLCAVVAVLLIIYSVSYFLYKPLLFAALPIASIAIFINFFIAGSLVYFFTNRLTKCASARRETTIASRSLTPRQSNYVRIAAKHCLLGCIGISMFNIFIPFAIIFYVWVYHHTIITFLLTVVICLTFHTIEMISVLMTFAFNKQFYNKCCKICDNGCNKFLLHIAKKKLDHPKTKQMRVNSTTTSTTQSRRISNLSHTTNSANTKSPAIGAIGAIGTIDTLHRLQTQESMATAVGSFDTMNLSKFSNPTDDAEDTQMDAPTLTNPPTHLTVHTASHDIFDKNH